MIDWNYNEKEYIEESQARLIPEGDHKVRIDGAGKYYGPFADVFDIIHLHQR